MLYSNIRFRKFTPSESSLLEYFCPRTIHQLEGITTRYSCNKRSKLFATYLRSINPSALPRDNLLKVEGVAVRSAQILYQVALSHTYHVYPHTSSQVTPLSLFPLPNLIPNFSLTFLGPFCLDYCVAAIKLYTSRAAYYESQ